MPERDARRDDQASRRRSNGGFSKAKSVAAHLRRLELVGPAVGRSSSSTTRPRRSARTRTSRTRSQVECTVETPVPNCTKVDHGHRHVGQEHRHEPEHGRRRVRDAHREHAGLRRLPPDVVAARGPARRAAEDLRQRPGGRGPDPARARQLPHAREARRRDRRHVHAQLRRCGHDDAAIACNATAAHVKAALEALLGDGAGNVKVTKAATSTTSRSAARSTSPTPSTHGQRRRPRPAAAPASQPSTARRSRSTRRGRWSPSAGASVRGQPVRRRQGAGRPGRGLPEHGQPPSSSPRATAART